LSAAYKVAATTGPQPAVSGNAALGGTLDYTDTCWYSADNGSTYAKRGKGTCIVAGPRITSTSGLSLTALNDKMMYNVSQNSAGSATTTTGSETPAVNQSAQIAILNYVVGNPIGSQNEQEFRNFMLQQDNTGYGKLDLNSSGGVDTTDATFIGNQLVGNLSSVNPTAYARYLRVITPSDSSYIGKSDFGGGVFAGGFFTGPTRSLRSVWAAGYPGAIVNGTTHASTVAQNASSFDTYIGNASTRGAFSNTTVQAGEPAMTNPVFYEGFYNQAAPTYYWYESYGSGSSTKTLQIYWGGTLIVNGTYAIGTTSYNNGTNNYVRHSGISNGFAFGGGPQSSNSDKYGNTTAYYAVFQATTSL
jgi:hypothetical protein